MEKNDEQSACNGDQHENDPADNLDEESAAKAKLTDDPSKVKFTQVQLEGFGDAKNGDAKVDIHIAQTTVGMGKEELMKYANEPFWVRLRMFLFLFFWIAWVAMLVGAVVIIILAPRCPPAPKLEWYQKSAMYQVEVKGFMDGDGNGVGDFEGIASKVDYFKEQNIEAIMLSDFYKKSADTDGILDHKQVDSSIGTLEDFKKMVDKLRENNIRLVIDFNPNHSSDEHPWFTASVEGQEPYKDFYIWADSPQSSLPNNWLNVNGEPAWTWNNQRKQFYLHTFGEHMPDLNLRNPLVRQELSEIVKFWLDKGVDGFKVVAASHLIEDEDLRDEPVATPSQPNKRQYKDINHIYTVDQPENAGLFAEWKQILMNISASSGIPKILMPELSGEWNTSVIYYGNETVPLTELPFKADFAEVRKDISGVELKNLIHIQERPAYVWPTLLVGSKSVRRLASRVGHGLVDAIHMVSIFAKGTPIMYNGDELGINDVPSAKNGELKLLMTTMPWSGSGTTGGFTNSSSSSYPVHPEFTNVNVMAQSKEKQSHLKVFSRLLALRGQPALNFGLQEYPVVTDDIFSLLRVRKGSPGYLVTVNLSGNSTTVDFTSKSAFLPEMARVEVRGSNIVDGPLAEGDHPKIALNHVHLGPKQAVVLSFVPIFE
ncbi:hypothetical protein JTE90_023110 [Oedothorax gibbosus]|uniref:alpha-glucosidase n=1 Tax=Oedothorax gibbosus TaxID=931172 RepID=A0AAV6UNS8_9ARAC|nr:hypothetical protein JTE90_023110 [Oedothorax gibbosus]